MPYRLVLIADDEIITGNELKTILETIHFTIPDVQPMALLKYPPKPTLAVNDPNYNSAYDEYKRVRNEAYAAYLADFDRWKNEIQEVTNLLSYMFVIATKVAVGINPNGTKRYEWQIISPPAYSFRQAAQKLTGATKPADPIEFICNGKF